MHAHRIPAEHRLTHTHPCTGHVCTQGRLPESCQKPLPWTSGLGHAPSGPPHKPRPPHIPSTASLPWGTPSQNTGCGISTWEGEGSTAAHPRTSPPAPFSDSLSGPSGWFGALGNGGEGRGGRGALMCSPRDLLAQQPACQGSLEHSSPSVTVNPPHPGCSPGPSLGQSPPGEAHTDSSQDPTLPVSEHPTRSPRVPNSSLSLCLSPPLPGRWPQAPTEKTSWWVSGSPTAGGG